MKKFIYGGLFLALVGMGLIGCKKSVVTPSTNSKVENQGNQNSKSLQKAKTIGAIHNRGLRDFYSNLSAKIQQNGYVKNMTQAEMVTLSENSFSEMMVKNGMPINKKEKEKFHYSLFNNENKSSTTNKAFVSQFTKISPALRAKFLFLLNNFDLVKSPNDVYELTQKMRLSENDLNKLEKVQLETALSTADSSYTYWYNNLQNWVNTLSGTTGIPVPAEMCAKCIAKEDIKGAVGGAVAGAVTGAIVTSEIGGVEGAVVGAIDGAATGAISGSVAEAVGELLDWLW